MSPIDKLFSAYTFNQDDLCSSPAIINFEVTNLPGSVRCEYKFINEDDNFLADWNASSIYDLNAPIEFLYVINCICPVFVS